MLKRYTKAILSNYLYLRKNEVDVSLLKKELTIVSKYDKEKRMLLYYETEKAFGIPLYYYEDYLNLAEDTQDLRMKGDQIKFNFTSALWEGQKRLLNSFEEHYSKGKTGFIIQAKTGSGKTIMAIKILSIIGRKALVIVPRSPLVSQWITRMVEHSDLTKSDIGIINGDLREIEDKKVIIALVHSLNAKKIDNNLKNSFGVVVFDEVDKSVPPETFFSVATEFASRIKIGMSATLKRTDGFDKVFTYNIEEVRLSSEINERMPATVLINEFLKSSGEVWGGLKKLNRRGVIISKLAANPERNHLIIKNIIRLIESERRVLVLSDRTWQLDILKKLLLESNYKKLNEKDIGFFVRTLSVIDKTSPSKFKKINIKKEYRDQVADTCKVILATYGMFSIGNDIKNLSGLLYATPQSTIEQMQGRIERFLENKKVPVVIDIVDRYYPETNNWARSRMSWYNKNNIKTKFIE